MHDVGADQRACATETCSAVYCHSLTPLDILVDQDDKALDNVVIGAGAVGKLHLVHCDSVSSELARIVELVIQPDDSLDVVVLEAVHEVVGAERTC